MNTLTTPSPTTSLADALEQYQSGFLTARNLAPRTRIEYGNDLRDLVTFLGTREVTSVREVERKHLEAYLAELDRRELKGSSRRRKVASIRSFFGFLEEQGQISLSPAHKLIPPEREYRQPRVLTEIEYKRLRDAVQYHPRDLAIIELLLQTGMRLSELSRLTLNDITLPAKITRGAGDVGSVLIRGGKGRKDRTITLNWRACRAIKSYLAIRSRAEGERVFLTKFGEGIGPRAVQRAVEKYLDEAMISNASVHTLRHTFATHMVKKGTKLDVVRQALGHSSLKTTSIYVELAREVMDKELQENAL